MSWPLSQDYNEAVQNPAANFADADLKAAQVATNALGLPMPYSGNFADVYQFVCPGGQRWAVKCFTREVPGLRQRYEAISAHLRRANLPFTVDFTYVEKGILVGGRWYPVLKMEWVEGLTLNQFVKKVADKPAALDGLLHIWARMGTYLRAAGVAHADLQHGNVLLVPAAGSGSLSLKLVDYDGMWVPALAGSKSGEVGHPSYQHPRRARDDTYSREVDRFPLLLVATALSALKGEGRALWEKYDDGDNLLFTGADLQAPTKSRLFLDLLRSKDPATADLAKQTLEALRGGVESAPLLEELMPEAARPTAVPAPSPKPAARPKTQVVAVAKPHAPPPGEEPEAPEPPPVRGPVIRPPAAAVRGRRRGVPAFAWVVGMIALALVATGVVAVVALRNSDEPPALATGGQVAQHKGEPQGGYPTSAQKRPPAPQAEPGRDSGKERPGEVPKGDNGEEKFFNGKDLAGWQGLKDYWAVKDGSIIGTCPPGELVETFLVSKQTYKDFDLKFRVQRKDGRGGTAVQFRSHVTDDKQWVVCGPYCEIGAPFATYVPGSLLVSPAATWGPIRASERVSRVYDDAGFNSFHIRCVGSHVYINVNGVTAVDGDYPDIPAEGVIALQFEKFRPPDELTFKDIVFEDLTRKSDVAVPPMAKTDNPKDPVASPIPDPEQEQKRKLDEEARQAAAAEAKKETEEDAAKQLQDARELFVKADKALQGGDAEEAERLQAEGKKALRAIKDKYPKTPAAKDADDEVAAARRLKDAADLFTKAAKDRRDGKSAMADQTEEGAVGALRQIISMYPRTQAAEKAKDRLMELGQPEK